MAAALVRFARFYNHHFDRRPIPTLIVTNGVLNTLADALVSVSLGIYGSGKAESV